MRTSTLKRLVEMEGMARSAKITVTDTESWALERSGLSKEQLIEQYGGIPQYAYHLMLKGVSRMDCQSESDNPSGNALERYKTMLNG